jgi:hypothetical protein
MDHPLNLLLPLENLFQDIVERFSDFQQDVWKMQK